VSGTYCWSIFFPKALFPSATKVTDRDRSCWSTFVRCGEGDAVDYIKLPLLPPPPPPPQFPIPTSPFQEEKVEFPTMSSEYIKKFVQNAKVNVTTLRLPARLRSKPVPPWGVSASKKEKREWMKKAREKLSNPSNYIRANPDNVQDLVGFLYLFCHSTDFEFTQLNNLYDENGLLKEDAKFVYIDTADFPEWVLSCFIFKFELDDLGQWCY
jgi:hypothetical protein